MRGVAAALVVALLGLGIFVTRAVLEGRSALSEAEAALAGGDAIGAIERYRRAARWYLPGAPHVRRAYDQMEAIAQRAEEEGDVQTALAAWRGVRGSILATRSVYLPFEERLEPADREIARLMAAVEVERDGVGAGDLEAWHGERLARTRGLPVGSTLVALVGLVLWIGGGAYFAARGITADDALDARPAAAAGLLVAAGLIIWLAGLASA